MALAHLLAPICKLESLVNQKHLSAGMIEFVRKSRQSYCLYIEIVCIDIQTRTVTFRKLLFCILKKKSCFPTPLVPFMQIRRLFQSISSIRSRLTGALRCPIRYSCVRKNDSIGLFIIFTNVYTAKLVFLIINANPTLQKNLH